MCEDLERLLIASAIVGSLWVLFLIGDTVWQMHRLLPYGVNW